jgi:hypothetical protein
MKFLKYNFRLSYLSFIFLLMGVLSSSFAQDKVIGQVFTKTEADQLFGPVLKSITVPVADLNKILDNCNGYVMFDLDITSAQTQAIATDEFRKPLNSYSKAIKPERVMHKYSKSKVQELLTKSGLSTSSKAPLLKGSASESSSANTTVTLEIRSNVFTVSTTAYTLEMSLGCPPACDL